MSLQKTIEVQFEDSERNFTTVVKGRHSNKLISMWYVHKLFDGHKCINVKFLKETE